MTDITLTLYYYACQQMSYLSYLKFY